MSGPSSKVAAAAHREWVYYSRERKLDFCVTMFLLDRKRAAGEPFALSAISKQLEENARIWIADNYGELFYDTEEVDE